MGKERWLIGMSRTRRYLVIVAGDDAIMFSQTPTNAIACRRRTLLYTHYIPADEFAYRQTDDMCREKPQLVLPPYTLHRLRACEHMDHVRTQRKIVSNSHRNMRTHVHCKLFADYPEPKNEYSSLQRPAQLVETRKNVPS